MSFKGISSMDQSRLPRLEYLRRPKDNTTISTSHRYILMLHNIDVTHNRSAGRTPQSRPESQPGPPSVEDKPSKPKLSSGVREFPFPFPVPAPRNKYIWSAGSPPEAPFDEPTPAEPRSQDSKFCCHRTPSFKYHACPSIPDPGKMELGETCLVPVLLV